MHEKTNEDECPRVEELIADRLFLGSGELSDESDVQATRSKLRVMHACGRAAGQLELRAELEASRQHVRRWKSMALTAAAMIWIVPGLMWLRAPRTSGMSADQALVENSATSPVVPDQDNGTSSFSRNGPMVQDSNRSSVLTPRMVVHLVRSDVWKDGPEHDSGQSDWKETPGEAVFDAQIGNPMRSRVFRAGDTDWKRFEI